MEKYLKPPRFDCDPNAVGSDKQFKHWLTTFKNFISTINATTRAPATSDSTADASPEATTDTKLITLINYVATNVYEYIADCSTYDDAIDTLTKIYVKPVNEIYARYRLATR